MIELLVICGLVIPVIMATTGFYFLATKRYQTYQAPIEELNKRQEALQYFQRDVASSQSTLSTFKTFRTSERFLILKKQAHTIVYSFEKEQGKQNNVYRLIRRLFNQTNSQQVLATHLTSGRFTHSGRLATIEMMGEGGHPAYLTVGMKVQ